MKVLLWLLIVLAIAIGVVWGIGAQLPADHAVTRTVTLPAEPERVYALISNVSDEPRWRPSVKSVEILPNVGTHMQWKESSGMGSIPLELVKDNPPLERVVRISDANLPFQGTWTYDLQPQGTGTTLTITENGRVPNPFWRFVSRYVMGYSKTIDTYVGDLTRATTGAQN